MYPSYDAISLCVNSKADRLGGVDAQYLKLDDKYGFKYYTNKDRALACYLRQKWAKRFGLGPAVGDFVEFEQRHYTYFGFVTEALKVSVKYEDAVWRKFFAYRGR